MSARTAPPAAAAASAAVASPPAAAAAFLALAAGGAAFSGEAFSSAFSSFLTLRRALARGRASPGVSSAAAATRAPAEGDGGRRAT
eukprot:scaffold103522_cov30-Phaeocystis_antarctica.AAC.1